MARCPICNDFEIGEGGEYDYNIWITLVTSFTCRYCQLLVKGIKKLYPRFPFERNEKHLKISDQYRPASRIKLVLELHNGGWLGLYSSCDESTMPEREANINFFWPRHLEQQACELQLQIFDDIAPIPGHAAMWQFIRSTVRTCLEEHPGCWRKQDITWFPSRLLFVNQISEGKRLIRLVETQQNNDSRYEYMALSHCLGLDKFIRTTKETQQSRQNGIDYLDLPRTFQDAVTVAQKLNISYIWIDSLCIVQDQEADWARHAEQMDKIYQNALFVLAAVSSCKASVPFLGPDAPSTRDHYQAIAINPVANELSTTNDSPGAIRARKYNPILYSDQVVFGPLEDRAWAWQERYCAVRILNFTSEEVKWTCRFGSVCECNQKSWKQGLQRNFSTRKEQLDNERASYLNEWREVVLNYARRRLTYATDRLPAIAGISSRFQRLLSSDYTAGLWQAELPFDLGWYHFYIHGPKETYSIPSAFNNGITTWSWASNFGANVYWVW